MKPLVSVILPVYNESLEWLEQALNSILCQSYKELEIIIILDNPDNVLLKEYIRKQPDKRIHFVVNNKNLGLPETLNVSLKFVNGDYVVRMDADDICELDRIEKQLSYLLDNNLDLIGCKYDTFDDDGEMINASVNLLIYHENIKEMLKYDQPMAHSSWLGKSYVFKNLKYHDVVGAEDYDFLCRAVLHGYKLGNHPEILLHVRMRSNGITSEMRYIQLVDKFMLVQSYRSALKFGRAYTFENSQIINMSKFKSTYDTYEKGKSKLKTNSIVGLYFLIRSILFMPYSKYCRFKIACRISANYLLKHQRSTL